MGSIGGFPYLMQLVGYCIWEEAGDAATIGREAIERGIDQALKEFRRGVLDSTYREMSKGDRAFAFAMLPDTEGSTLAEVARRMGKGTNYASTYKSRLLRQGVIGQRAGFTFDFELPGFREYLQGMQG